MKKFIPFVFALGAFFHGYTAFSLNHFVSAQSYRTAPNLFGGGTTTMGPSGTYRTTPNRFGGGYTTRGPAEPTEQRPIVSGVGIQLAAVGTEV